MQSVLASTMLLKDGEQLVWELPKLKNNFYEENKRVVLL